MQLRGVPVRHVDAFCSHSQFRNDASRLIGAARFTRIKKKVPNAYGDFDFFSKTSQFLPVVVGFFLIFFF